MRTCVGCQRPVAGPAYWGYPPRAPTLSGPFHSPACFAAWAGVHPPQQQPLPAMSQPRRMASRPAQAPDSLTLLVQLALSP
jgi:hypothetical protein